MGRRVSLTPCPLKRAVPLMKGDKTAAAIRALRGHGRGERLTERLLTARKAERELGRHG
jgi:hypothetical protein